MNLYEMISKERLLFKQAIIYPALLNNFAIGSFISCFREQEVTNNRIFASIRLRNGCAENP